MVSIEFLPGSYHLKEYNPLGELHMIKVWLIESVVGLAGHNLLTADPYCQLDIT